MALLFFHIFFSMFSRVSATFKKLIHIYCLLYRIVIYICKVNKAQNKNINDMKTENQKLELLEIILWTVTLVPIIVLAFI